MESTNAAVRDEKAIDIILTFMKRFILKKRRTLRDASSFYRCCIDSQIRSNVLQELSHQELATHAFTARYSIDFPSHEQLASLNADCFGKQYATFMQYKAGTESIFLPPPQDSEWDYYQYHVVQIHDIIHVLINAETDLIGEVKVWAFWIGQIPQDSGFFLSMAKLMLAAFFEAKSADHVIALMDAICAGWRMGRQAIPIFGFPWHSHWSTPLHELRSLVGIAV